MNYEEEKAEGRQELGEGLNRRERNSGEREITVKYTALPRTVDAGNC